MKTPSIFILNLLPSLFSSKVNQPLLSKRKIPSYFYRKYCFLRAQNVLVGGNSNDQFYEDCFLLLFVCKNSLMLIGPYPAIQHRKTPKCSPNGVVFCTEKVWNLLRPLKNSLSFFSVLNSTHHPVP